MNEFQFKVIELYPNASRTEWEDKLNELGREGWQVVGTFVAGGLPQAILQRQTLGVSR